MNKFLLYVLLLPVWMLTSCGEQVVHITVTNELEFPRKEVVSLSYAYIRTVLHLEEGETVILRNGWWKQQAYQVVNQDQDLIFLADVKKKGIANYWIKTGTPKSFAPKAYGRLVPERKDDFAWENDKVAFRTYGPALKATGEISNGVDIWVKNTSELVIDKWYHDDLAGVQSYHENHGEGLDFYTVGRTLGCGVAAPFTMGKLWLGENFKTAEILEQGPIRISFKLHYEPYLVADSLITETRIITLDAGSYFNRMEQSFTGQGVSQLDLGIGIAKRQDGNDFVQDRTDSYMAYWEPEVAPNGHIAVGVVLPPQEKIVKRYRKQNGISQLDISKRKFLPDVTMTVSDNHLLMVTPYPEEPFIYYFGGAWSEAGFANQEAWFDFVKQYSAVLQSPLRVGWK